LPGSEKRSNGVESVGRTAGTDGAFEALLAYVEDELDFATSHYTDAYLDRRISARQRRTDADGYGEYHDVLREDPEEQAALLDALSINVTGFFRNPEMWERLRGVLRDLAAEHRRLRLWSAPCADGREPYSLAMLALDDPAIDARNVEITATDISEDALAAARRGVYETTATTDIAEELAPIDGAEQYVDRDDDCFEVRESVRDLVEFRRHDLINGEPLARSRRCCVGTSSSTSTRSTRRRFWTPSRSRWSRAASWSSG
jgi:chemotaxis protein methyltransferase CheR